MKLKLTRNEFLIALEVNNKLLRDKRNNRNYKVINESNLDNIILTLKPYNTFTVNAELLANENQLNKYYKFSSGLDFKIKNK